MEQKKVRDSRFDNMKALLIFLVVLGHVLSNYGETEGSDFLYKLIFSFHMPAFIFVSGYFAKCDPKRVLSKLFPLYVVFQCVHLLLNTVIGNIRPDICDPPEKFQLFRPEWTLWYLLALIIYQLLLPVFTTENKKHRLYYMILAAVLGLLIGENAGAGLLSVSRIFVFLPFFLLGYYEKDSHILLNFGRDKCLKISRAVSACLAAFLVVIFASFHSNIPAKWLYGSDPYEPGSFTWPARVFAWVLALAWIWILLVWVPNRKIPLMGVVGANTLPVYLFHPIVIRLLQLTPLGGLMKGNLAALILLSAVMTVCLSWTGFEKAVRRIAVPYDWKKQKQS